MSSRFEMSLTENGIKLSVRDDAKTFQANAFLQKELFRHLTFANFDDDGGDGDNEESSANNRELVFGLDTASIIDCLSMFGQSGQTGEGLAVLQVIWKSCSRNKAHSSQCYA